MMSFNEVKDFMLTQQRCKTIAEYGTIPEEQKLESAQFFFEKTGWKLEDYLCEEIKISKRIN
jgi:hypothetical protein